MLLVSRESDLCKQCSVKYRNFGFLYLSLVGATLHYSSSSMHSESLFVWAVVQLYQWWVDSKTFVELTRPWYGKAVGFPFSFYLPLRRQSAARNRLMSLYCNSCCNDSELETVVLIIIIIHNNLRVLFYVT